MNNAIPKYLNEIQELLQPLTGLKGIGPKRAEALDRREIRTLLDLLYFVPRRYEDRRHILPIQRAPKGTTALVRGEVAYGREEVYFRTRKRLFRIVVKDHTGTLDLIWFQYQRAHLAHLSRRGLKVFAYGGVQENRGRRQMIHPEVSEVTEDEEAPGVCPVYPVVEGVPNRVVKAIVEETLKRTGPFLRDGVPVSILERHGLMGLAQALREIHAPPHDVPYPLLLQERTPFHKRLIFDSFFGVMLPMALKKKVRQARKGFIFAISDGLLNSVKKALPFPLTASQEKAIREIASDLMSGTAMNRLLQGDVGCGKTVVAAVAAHMAIHGGFQVALMAPTQVLAEQHYEYFLRFSEIFEFRPSLLTGALKRQEREAVYQRIGKGSPNIIIGTQALIQEGLRFERLGLVIIDEQHRFGVGQRALLGEKGSNPHLLIMTATPIPRSLALTLYLDLDVSTIDEYPPGHRSVKTYLVTEDQEERVYQGLEKRMSMGQQALLICPVIEGTEETDLRNVLQTYDLMNRLFPAFRIGLIHGRVPREKKTAVMEAFRRGQIHLLVGTTVVEVGVHAPGATVLVVMHPDRFGLAQLHQLRGRVGRGPEPGICLLMSHERLSEGAHARLQTLLQCHSGIQIAQKDMEMRGFGEWMGSKQSGPGELDYSEIMTHWDLLEKAREEAERIAEIDPYLQWPEHRSLRAFLPEQDPNLMRG